MSRGRIALAALATLAVGAIVVSVIAGSTPSLPAATLSAVPAETSAVARIRISALLSSLAWQHLVVEQGQAGGLERIEEACGTNPLDQLDELVVFISGERRGSLDHVGFLARGTLDHEALGACIHKVVEEDGGELRRVEIDGYPAVAGGRGDSRIAFVGRDGLVGGDERVVKKVLAVVDGRGESALSDTELTRLWGEVQEGADIAIAARVPDRWRDTARRYLADADLADARASLADLAAFGANVRLGRGIAVGLVLTMGSEQGPGRLEDAIRSRVQELLSRTLVSLSVAGPVLRRIRTETRGRDLILTAEVRNDEIPSLVELFEELARRRQAPTEERIEPLEPDEVLRPEPAEGSPD